MLTNPASPPMPSTPPVSFHRLPPATYVPSYTMHPSAHNPLAGAQKSSHGPPSDGPAVCFSSYQRRRPRTCFTDEKDPARLRRCILREPS